jgi:hypothetical protein
VATDGGGDAAVLIRDDELDAAESTLAQLPEQLRPVLLALLGSEGHRQQPSMDGVIDPVGHERRNVLDRASPACVKEGGVQVEVGNRALDGSSPQLLDLLPEHLRHPADRRAGNPLSHERMAQAGHVARRDALDVRRRGQLVDLIGAALIATDHVDGRAAVPRTRHSDLHLAHRRQESPEVGPVEVVLAVAQSLVPTRPDHLPDLLLEQALQHQANRPSEQRAKVRTNLLLLDGGKGGTLFHGESSSPPWQGRSIA